MTGDLFSTVGLVLKINFVDVSGCRVEVGQDPLPGNLAFPQGQAVVGLAH